jgi:ubiquitin-protein ligase
MSSNLTILQKKRISNELYGPNGFNNNPLDYITVYPDENNNLIMYFLINGQKDTDFEGGHYIGKIIHSNNYPFEPPDYYMLTPNGRFNINTKICLTNSSFHRETWNAGWTISSLLNGFYSVFIDDDVDGIGKIKDSKTKRHSYALNSIVYNIDNFNDIYSKFNFNHFKIKNSNTNVIVDNVNTTVIADNVNTTVIVDNVNTNVIADNVNTTVIVDNVNTNVIADNVNTNVITDNVNTNVITDNVNTNVITDNVNIITNNTNTNIINTDNINVDNTNNQIKPKRKYTKKVKNV